MSDQPQNPDSTQPENTDQPKSCCKTNGGENSAATPIEISEPAAAPETPAAAPNAMPAAPQYAPPAAQQSYVAPAAPTAPAAAEPGFNTLSIAGFVVSFFLNLVGAIMSIVALGQIKKSGERGRGLAIAGIVIGFASTAFTIIYFLFIVTLIGTAGLAGAAQSVAETSTNDVVSSEYCDSIHDAIESAQQLGTDPESAMDLYTELSTISIFTENLELEEQLDGALANFDLTKGAENLNNPELATALDMLHAEAKVCKTH